MRTSTQLHRGISHADHAYLVTVLLAKERQSTGVLRLFDAHHLGLARDGSLDLVVDPVFNGLYLFSAQRFGVREVKAQTLIVIERSCLRDMVSQQCSERCMQQVCRRVVLLDLRTALIDRSHHFITHRELPVHFREVHIQKLLRIQHLNF